MFTGIIKSIGTILERKVKGEVVSLWVSTQEQFLGQSQIDDSVSINGVCQTIVEISAQSFRVDVVFSTLQKTTLGSLAAGENVNLELALRFGDRLGGHLVQGHVQATTPLLEIIPRDGAYEIIFALPDFLAKYIVPEGSITLDGVSLTIAYVQESKFAIALIPHSWSHTIFQFKRPGDLINVEVDMMAKYLEQLAIPYLQKLSLNKDVIRGLQLN